jgi:hypothetical protein
MHHRLRARLRPGEVPGDRAVPALRIWPEEGRVRLPCRLPCSGEQPLVRLVPWRPWPASSWGPVALVELE